MRIGRCGRIDVLYANRIMVLDIPWVADRSRVGGIVCCLEKHGGLKCSVHCTGAQYFEGV